jgi:hypothetical protein
MMVFHNWPATLFPLDEEERAMADALARYWTRLAADGDPNGDDDPAWSPYDPIADDHFAIDTPFGHGARFRDAECALWDPYVE